MEKIACAFTGHRPKKFPWRYNEADERCVRLKEAIAAQIRQMAELGVTGFLSGMAEGVDIWSAQAVLALREKNPALKLHCILPHRGQADRWSAPARERYRSILRQADSIRLRQPGLSRGLYAGAQPLSGGPCVLPAGGL